MADKQLKRNVYVGGVLYGPDGEKPTAEVLKQIDNPNVFEDPDGAPVSQQDNATGASDAKQNAKAAKADAES